MTTPAETIREFMTASIAAWPTGDAKDLGQFFSGNATYRNGPLEPAKGREAIIVALTQMMSIGGEVDVDLVHLVADGPIVMTERVDYWKSGTVCASLRVAGVFEVHQGLITAWRDYFDTNEFSSQLPGDG